MSLSSFHSHDTATAALFLYQRLWQEHKSVTPTLTSPFLKPSHLARFVPPEEILSSTLQESIYNILNKEITQSKEERKTRLSLAKNRLLDYSFRVAVVATMSSGKSTLLNALLGQHILPARAQSTTATIVRIEHRDGVEHVAGYALDAHRRVVAEASVLSAELLSEWNDREDVERIELLGDIRWLDNSSPEQILIYDTPGPNSVQNLSHRKRLETFLFGEHYESPDLILYVFDATRMLVDDDHRLLSDVLGHFCQSDALAHYRCIFALNKVDELNQEGDGNLAGIVERLEHHLKQNFNIENPIILPISAKSADLANRVLTGQSLSKRQRSEYQFLLRCLEHRTYQPPWLRQLRWAFTEKTDYDLAVELQFRSGLLELQALLGHTLRTVATPLRLLRAFQTLVKENIISIPLTFQLQQGMRDLQSLEPFLPKGRRQQTSVARHTHEEYTLKKQKKLNQKDTISKSKKRKKHVTTSKQKHIDSEASSSFVSSVHDQEESMSLAQVVLEHNPITLKTVTVVDGKPDSTLNEKYKDQRIQGWIESYLEELHKRLNEDAFYITFRGIEHDAYDLEEILTRRQQEGRGTYQLQTECIPFEPELLTEQFLRLLDGIKADVLTQDLSEGQKKEEQEMFTNIRSLIQSKAFKVAVVACVSSGKSTLINAMLGKHLLPARNEATTAKLIHIQDVDGMNHVEGEWYDIDGQKVGHEPALKKEKMEELNKGEQIFKIILKTDIPWIHNMSTGHLELIDTPGPNNAANQEHRRNTFSIVQKSETAPDIVLYVMDFRKMEVTDDKELLEKVAKEIRKGGYEANDRFMFVVNCIDELDPDQEGSTTSEIVAKVKKYLAKEFGISNPRIFPLSALAALLYRLHSSKQELNKFQQGKLTLFENTLQSFEDMEQAAICSESVKQTVRHKLAHQNGFADPLARSGILILEESIVQFLQRYSMPIKLSRFYREIHQKLLQQEKQAAFEKQLFMADTNLERIQNDLAHLQKILQDSQIVDEIGVILEQKKKELEKQPFGDISEFEFRVTKFLTDSQLRGSGKDSVERMQIQIADLESRVNNAAASTESQVRVRIQETLHNVQQEVITLFEDRLDQLLQHGELAGIKIESSMWSSNLQLSLSNIVARFTETRTVQETKTRTVKKERAWYNPLKWLSAFNDSYKWYEQEETHTTTHTVREVDKEKIRQKIQESLAREVKEMRNSAKDFQTDQLELLCRSVLRLVEIVKHRIQAKVAELQQKIGEKSKLEQEKQKAEAHLQRFNVLRIKLEQVALLGLTQ